MDIGQGVAPIHPRQARSPCAASFRLCKNRRRGIKPSRGVIRRGLYDRLDPRRAERGFGLVEQAHAAEGCPRPRVRTCSQRRGERRTRNPASCPLGEAPRGGRLWFESATRCSPVGHPPTRSRFSRYSAHSAFCGRCLQPAPAASDPWRAEWRGEIQKQIPCYAV